MIRTFEKALAFCCVMSQLAQKAGNRSHRQEGEKERKRAKVSQVYTVLLSLR